MDKFRALEVFVKIAEVGSFSEAAKQMSLSAPSVTRILNDYENELGVLLFHRTTRALKLTEDGRTFLMDAKHILNTYNRASDALKGAHISPKGTLRVTASTLFGQHYILPLLMEYMDKFPDVRAEAIFLDRVVNIVEEGFDLAVRIGPLTDSSMIATRIGSVRLVVCACPDYLEKNGLPQNPEDLQMHNIIQGKPVCPTSEWKFKNDLSVRLNPKLTVSTMSAAVYAAKSGWGITRVLSYQIGPELGDGGLKTVLSEFEPPPLPIHIIHPEGRSASAKVRTFLDLARERIRGNKYLNS